MHITIVRKLAFVLVLLIASNRTQSQIVTSAMEKVYAMNEIVSDPERQVGNMNPDSLPSLPFGIVKEVGQTQVIIAIDSAYFLEDGAYFSAYLALDFPGADQKLAFAAKDIKFNPRGIIGGEQSRLMLVSQHLIEVGPNTKLLLPSDGSNYVNWSCNGFESVNLHGFFLFEDGILSPPENTEDSVVTAEFEVNVTDMHNMMAMVDFSPFVVKGIDDFSFTVSEAYVDMSDYGNPQNVILPNCYQETYSNDINLWRGFYLREFSVKLPEELNKSDAPISLFASNMFIDDAGVTGDFGGTNLFSTTENDMNGDWGFSVDSLLVGLTLNRITKGRMAGEITIPAFDNAELKYGALICQNDETRLVDFCFELKPAAEMSMSVCNSRLTLFTSSSLTVARANRKLRPQLCLNGQWTLDNESWSFHGLAFEQFTITTAAPFITQGYFSLIADAPKAGGFPVSLTNIGFGIINNQPVFGADIGLNFGDDPATGFSASTTVRIYTEVIKNSPEEKSHWRYDHFSLSQINLAVNTNAISLSGIINYHQEDPVYGRGFYGGLNLQINNVMDNPMSMACAFGRMNDDYRYWMVDATFPTQIPLGASTIISSITGGIAYHMRNTKTQTELINGVSPTQNSGATLSQDYVPDEAAGLFFRAGVGFRNAAKEDVLNGDVMLSVSFNSNGGLEYVNLNGNVYSMVSVSERFSGNNYAIGTANINYDNQARILNAQLNMSANFSNALTATIWSQFYFSPGLWFIHLGKPSNPCNVHVVGLANANAYFMIGQQLEPMPSPPPQIVSVFNTMNDQRNESSIVTGNGIACGMNLNASFDKSIDLTDEIYLYGNGAAGLGFDMTLYKYATTSHCEGSSEPFGLNYWFLSGQVYAYAGLNIGVAKVDKWDFPLLQANLAMLLQGKLPKPSYVYGGVHVQGSVLGLLEIDQTFDFDFGTNCVIVN